MAPVIRELGRPDSPFEHVVIATAQHREMLDQVLSVFDIKPDFDLALMRQDHGLADFASRSLSAVSALLADLKPDAILIQGDTTTVMTAALAAFYQGIRIGHVEAGLRSFDRKNPFPEEVNRRIAGCLADMHFAPTTRARENLLREGAPDSAIFITGNTIVDALMSIDTSGEFSDPTISKIDFNRKRVVLVTAHRRENHGEPLRALCGALRTLAETFSDIEIVYPVHLNSNVRQVAREELRGIDRIHLLEPVSYSDMLKLMARCYIVLTDSGGIQEEAPSFHKPVLVLREVTERPELIEAGGGKVIGTDRDQIVEETSRLLNDSSEHERMSAAVNPFGDGRAARRIAAVLAERL